MKLTEKQIKAVQKCAPFFFAEDGDMYTELAKELNSTRDEAKEVYYKWLYTSNSKVATSFRQQSNDLKASLFLFKPRYICTRDALDAIHVRSDEMRVLR